MGSDMERASLPDPARPGRSTGRFESVTVFLASDEMQAPSGQGSAQ